MSYSSNGSVDRGDGEKILAMCSLGLGSFLFGMLPAVISAQNRRRFPLTISLLLCFGAGILLATALVHILPEVRKQMNSNFAEITIQHTHSHGSNRANSHRNSNLDTDRTPLLSDRRDQYANQNGGGQQNSTDTNDESTHRHSYYNTSNCAEEAVIAESNARLCHTSHEEPCVQSMTGTLGLFVALSLHSAIEGLAIGVQNSSRKVLFLLGAVACHKLVMGFCLGLEFRSNPQTTLRQHFIGIVVFALGAICGIGIGMIIADIPSGWSTAVLPIVQALAGGTLFYVTVCEVIPREKSRWHQNAGRKIAGFGQFLAVISGFALMCCINYFLDDGDS
uniref:Protein zntD n=1 Tax=Bactrocera latifrons TaxID=174628 RepID=A0A0K8WCA7_BACLA